MEIPGIIWTVLGAALAAGLPCAGSGMGIGLAGQAASGLMSEEPEKFGKVLILVIMPGTQGIYGLLIMFYTAFGVGLLAGQPQEITTAEGLMIFFGCLAIAIAGLFSAIYQGRAAASAIGLVAKKPEEFVKGLIFVAMVETYAVFGLLVSFLLVWGVLN